MDWTSDRQSVEGINNSEASGLIVITAQAETEK